MPDSKAGEEGAKIYSYLFSQVRKSKGYRPGRHDEEGGII
jgi:hypothetical protein